MKPKVFQLIILFVFGTFAAFSQTPIYDIQGDGETSPYNNTVVNTHGIVTANFQGSSGLSGFFIQDASGDENPATSDGIFVYTGSQNYEVSVGDLIEISATVSEYYSYTRLQNLQFIEVQSSENSITPTEITLPMSDYSDFEKYEGMLVTFAQDLVVTGNHNLGRYGELALAHERLLIPTQFIDPNDDPASGTNSEGESNVEAIHAHEDYIHRSLITLDDGSSQQNPNPIPYIDTEVGTLRSGSTVNNLTGVISYEFNTYRIHPTSEPVFSFAERPDVPEIGDGNLKIVSFNVLNFFTTIDDGTNGARGADTEEELIRQRDKLVSAITRLDADIFAFMEIENSAEPTPDYLVNAINAVAGEGMYQKINDYHYTGFDKIKCIFIYKPGKVTPVGEIQSSINQIFLPPPIAQTFELNNNGARFSVVANHYRYKGCDGATGENMDQNDGQGCYNLMRKMQSLEILNFIEEVKAEANDDDIIFMGDFNTYEQEDPNDILLANGLINLNPGKYSYVYQNQWGTLDYMYVNPEMNAQVVASDIWHINSDEPRVIDYNTEDKPHDLYQTNAYRSSDHDPVICVLQMTGTGIADEFANKNNQTQVYPNPANDYVTFDFSEKNFKKAEISIYTMEGQLIETHKLNKGQNDYRISAEHLSGSFFYKIDFIRNGKVQKTESGILLAN